MNVLTAENSELYTVWIEDDWGNIISDVVAVRASDEEEAKELADEYLEVYDWFAPDESDEEENSHYWQFGMLVKSGKTRLIKSELLLNPIIIDNQLQNENQ